MIVYTVNKLIGNIIFVVCETESTTSCQYMISTERSGECRSLKIIHGEILLVHVTAQCAFIHTLESVVNDMLQQGFIQRGGGLEFPPPPPPSHNFPYPAILKLSTVIIYYLHVTVKC